MLAQEQKEISGIASIVPELKDEYEQGSKGGEHYRVIDEPDQAALLYVPYLFQTPSHGVRLVDRRSELMLWTWNPTKRGSYLSYRIGIGYCHV